MESAGFQARVVCVWARLTQLQRLFVSPSWIGMKAALQAAGHEGAQQGNGLYIKPATDQELEFYQWLVTSQSPLAPFVPLFMGTLQEQDKLGGSRREGTGRLAVLEDLCEGFVAPSILDVKLGSQLWDSNANPEKRLRLQQVSESTTSGSLGFRIAGMSIVDGEGRRVAFGKQFGRDATPSTIVSHLAQFFPNLGTSDYVFSVLRSFIREIQQLRDALLREPLEMHSASVLLIYEGDEDVLRKKVDEPENLEPLGDDSEDESSLDKVVELRLIDFAHTTRASEPDADVLKGLDALIHSLETLYAQEDLR